MILKILTNTVSTVTADSSVSKLFVF